VFLRIGVLACGCLPFLIFEVPSMGVAQLRRLISVYMLGVGLRMSLEGIDSREMKLAGL
jgi:hypothetical protein